jgi:membrane-bound lytic murein transglycosylase B
MKWIFTRARLARHVSLAASLLLLAPLGAVALDLERDDVRSFISELESTHDFDRAYVEAQLGSSELKQSIIDAISRPAEGVLTWGKYRNIFIQPERIEAGVRFYEEHKEALDRIAMDTGVPPEMLLGIIGVESYYGRITGTYRVIDALTTLGFDYPPRAKFFRSELSHAFRLAREENMELAEFMGSYAGAMGPPQFIPSSYRAYAVDGDGDGKRDLLNNWDDILASVANYFVEHNWQPGGQVAARATISETDKTLPLNKKLQLESNVAALKALGVEFDTSQEANKAAGLWELEGADGVEYWVGFDNLYVITRYNRSVMYALATWQLGEAVMKQANAQ